jgi:hypothetical protein
MVPFGGLLPWLKIQNLHQWTPEDLQDLANHQSKAVLRPQLASGTEDQDEDIDQPQVCVQNLCFIPKPWAAQFLAPLSPWGAMQAFQSLLASLPVTDHIDFDFIEAWLKIACTHTLTVPGESRLCARWQQSYSNRRVLQWIKRHLQYVNQMPQGMVQNETPIGLNPQECFNKALDAVAALKPIQEAKTYTTAELQQIQAACSLSMAKMDTILPPFHMDLLAEGRTKRGTESVLTQALWPRDDTDNLGLIHVLPELVANIMACK